MLAAVPTARALSHDAAGLNIHCLDEVNSDDVEVYSKSSSGHADTQVLDIVGVGFDAESHPGEGMLLKNPRSGVKAEDIELWRYLYRIPPSVEIWMPTTHERIDWVVPG